MNGDEIMVNNIYGTDIKSDWSFTDGDLNIVKDKINLSQAVVNRLKTDAGTYDIFYKNYGGNLFEEMGELNHPTIHEYIRIEVESILQQDPRINNVECTVNKTYSNGVTIDLKLTPVTEDEVVELNLVWNEDSPILLDMNSSELADRS